MEWCSYFRVRDGITVDQVDAVLGPLLGGYTKYPKAIVQVSAADSVEVVTYYKFSMPDEPGWLVLLEPLTGVNHITGLRGRAHSALIITGYSGRCYLLAFGNAHTIAKQAPIERRFGKISVSNGKIPEEVRSIKAKVHGAAGKVRVERRGRGGPTGQLEVPRQANMAAGLSAKVQVGGVDHIATGDSGVRTVAPLNPTELVGILSQLETWWSGGAEADPQLASLDRILDIRDNAQITQLDDRRRADIVSGNQNPFSLCLDDDEIWDATLFEYVVNKIRNMIPVPDESNIFAALHAASTVPGVDPLAVRYYATVPTRQTEIPGRLADNLGYEFNPGQNGDTFLYEDGGWYRASASWKSTVSNDVISLQTQSASLLAGVNLIHALGCTETEPAYMHRFVNDAHNSGKSLLMHLSFPPTNPQLELCDICFDGSILFFVKRGCDRDACGDVSQQALQSALALVDTNPAFLHWANGELSTRGWSVSVTPRQPIVFCLLLITGNATRQPADLSVRSLDALSDHYRSIESLGFRAAVAIV